MRHNSQEEFKQKINYFAKTVITDNHEIMLIYSDPAKTDNEVSVMEFGKKEGALPIKLQVLTVADEHKEFFAKPDPAIFIDEAILLLHYDST